LKAAAFTHLFSHEARPLAQPHIAEMDRTVLAGIIAEHARITAALLNG
jgi:hypothetical protein